MIKAEFFDIFGIFVFIYIIAISIMLLKNRKISRWMKLTLLAVGILGVIIDGFIIITTYLI